MNAGRVDLLVILGGNPVYTAPADLEFADALDKVPLRVHLSLYDDETSALCHWHFPEAHFLEAWSDARGYDGTVSIVQPLIAPLYGGKSAHEVLAAMSDRPERSGVRHRARVLGEAGGAARPNERASALAAVAARRRRPGHGVRRAKRRSDVRPQCAIRAVRNAQPHAEGLEIAFRHDPSRPRRPLRQQRLAAGAAEADHQADLGQRGARQPGDRRGA